MDNWLPNQRVKIESGKKEEDNALQILAENQAFSQTEERIFGNIW